MLSTVDLIGSVTVAVERKVAMWLGMYWYLLRWLRYHSKWEKPYWIANLPHSLWFWDGLAQDDP